MRGVASANRPTSRKATPKGSRRYETLGAVILGNLYVRFCKGENAVRHLPISPDWPRSGSDADLYGQKDMASAQMVGKASLLVICEIARITKYHDGNN